MAELRTMAAGVGKNAADVENYSKITRASGSLHQMKRESSMRLIVAVRRVERLQR